MKTKCTIHLPLLLLTCVAPLVTQAQLPAQLLARYTFDGTAADATGNSPAMELLNTTFVNGTLCLNGIYEGNPDGFHAFARITGFSYQSFTVALDFSATDYSNNNILTGGYSYRWFSLRHNAGRLEVTLNNQALVYLVPDSLLKTNEWQSVICSVDAAARRILTVLNGQRLADIALSPSFHFDVIGSPAETTDGLFTFANYSNGSAFHGYADNLKVWNRALTSSEINAQIQRPSLSLRRVGANQIVLSWPNPSTGYVLQQTGNMAGQGAGWMAVTNPPVIVGPNKEVMLTATGAFCMFRLHQP